MRKQRNSPKWSPEIVALKNKLMKLDRRKWVDIAEQIHSYLHDKDRSSYIGGEDDDEFEVPFKDAKMGTIACLIND